MSLNAKRPPGDEYGQPRWNGVVRGKPRTRIGTCPRATVSTTTPTWIEPGANPGLRGEGPAMARPSRCTHTQIPLPYEDRLAA
jgi:hypothetical protein